MKPELKITPARTGYVNANGVVYYYEIHGRGDPLLLLHGGLGSIEMVGSALLPQRLFGPCRERVDLCEPLGVAVGLVALARGSEQLGSVSEIAVERDQSARGFE
jgi:hypothetical protein